MNVLLIGGSGNVTNAILEKLNKEGDRVYVLTGCDVKKHTYRHVFEQYSFSYDSSSIKEIFESISPDVTIFMGAYDTNFDWSDPRKESVRYSAGLLNILLGYSLVKCGRFIYLSSDEVYSGSYSTDIAEEEPTSARSFKGLTISRGEDLCRTYQKFDGLDIVVLRLDHLYAIPEKPEEVNDACSKMCVQALKTGVIEANSRNKFSLLYISDAVEFIYSFVRENEHKRALYHISPSAEINEAELAELVQKEMGEDVKISDNTVGDEYRLILSGKRYEEEFSGEAINTPENTVHKVALYIKRHKNVFLSEEDEGKGFWGHFSQTAKMIIKALIPFIENLVLFIPFFMLNNRAVGSQYFNKLDFYLLYVLLFAIVYGQQQATFSAILATAGYIFRQMYTRSGFEVVLDYNTYVWVAQLFILGLVVGYMRDQLRIVRKEGKDEANYLAGQIDDIQDINSTNVRIKNALGEQIENHNQSIGRVYEITSELDQYAPDDVLFYAAEVIARLLESKDVAVYSVAGSGYARLFSSTSEKARSLGNSIKYTDMSGLIDDIAAKKVYINKELLPDRPILARGIFDDDQLILIVMVWGIPWERMNLSAANMLTVICYLIQNAVLRANRYQKALERERYKNGTKILERDAFTSLVRAHLNAQKKGLTECTLLRIYVTEQDLCAAGERIVKLLRQSDYLGELEDGNLYVLLSNTPPRSVHVVIERFAASGFEADIGEDISVG